MSTPEAMRPRRNGWTRSTPVSRSAIVTPRPSNPGGQTWGWSVGVQVGSNPTVKVFKTIFNGTWSANPTFSWGATAATYQMWMIVLRGADTLTAGTQPVNDNNCCSSGVYLTGTFLASLPSPFNVTASGFTTSTDNAMVFAHWG